MNPKVIYRIASFNIRQFSNNSVMHNEDKDSKKSLEAISNIVRDNNIDIIAIQEIAGVVAFKELLAAIAFHYVQDITAEMREREGDIISENGAGDYVACVAGKWQGRWASPNSKWGTAISEEGYAFIWNSERLDLPENDRGRVQPVIKHKSEIYYVRPPFYGRFITKDIMVKFEICLLNTHVLYTKNASLKKVRDSGIDVELLNSDDKMERIRVKKELMEFGLTPMEIDVLEQFVNKSDIQRRQMEVNNLIKEIMVREEDSRGWGSYVIMLGDYNLNLNSSNGGYKNRKATIPDTITYAAGKKGEQKSYSIVQKELTTLKAPPNKEKDTNNEYDGLNGNERYANNYDHFTYNSNFTMEGQAGGRGVYISNPPVRINAIEQMGLSNREYFERVSDHLPILIEIGF